MSIETMRGLGGPPGGQGGIGGIDDLESLRSRDVGAPNVQSKDGPSFAETLGQALGAVEKQQLQADDQAARVALGGGNLHEMSLALEKADISMRLAMKVRNKLVDAYNEIMRMGV
jgi:flagellar hook-basal body complex protein FliE